MLERELTVCNKLGIHARVSAKIVKIASRYSSKIEITANNKTVNAKSIMGVMLLAAKKDSSITFKTDGPDEQEAMDHLVEFINNKCDEE